MPKSACAACNETFSSLAAFDRHQRQRGGVVHCSDPADVGLVHAGDKWKMPGPKEPEKVHAGGQPWRGECAKCGQPMGKKPGRGRPPKSCSDCGGKGILLTIDN